MQDVGRPACSSPLGHLGGWRCQAHTGYKRGIPASPPPCSPGTTWPSSAPVGVAVSPRERRGTREADRQQRLGPARGFTAGPQERGDRPRPAHQVLKPVRHMPREGSSAPESASFPLRLGSRPPQGHPCLPTLARSPETPGRERQDPAPLQTPECSPTGSSSRSGHGLSHNRIAGGPRFAHPRCHQLPPVFPKREALQHEPRQLPCFGTFSRLRPRPGPLCHARPFLPAHWRHRPASDQCGSRPLG